MMGRAKQILRNILISLGILLLTNLCTGYFATFIDNNNPFAFSMFILAVALIARCTTGYVYGIVASAVSVLCVNTIFTAPFWEFNLTKPGYALDFSVMLIVSMLISTLTSRVKKQEAAHIEAEREKTRANLLRAVSHDLRTPLTGIIGASTLLMEDADISAEEKKELLAGIHSDAQWLSRVTENILSVTKLSGHVRLKTEEEVVEEIVGSAIVKYHRQKDTLPVIVDKPEEIVTVPMEATLIEQVLINLFENASMHGETATKIQLRIENLPGAVRITVSDDGKGIPTNILAKIREGTAMESDERTHGMGIGLSTCRSIIQAHGGEISVANGGTGGTVVRFTLPALQQEENHAEGKNSDR